MNFTIAISRSRAPFIKNIWLIIFAFVFILIWTDSLIGTTNIANWLLENALTYLFIVFNYNLQKTPV